MKIKKIEYFGAPHDLVYACVDVLVTLDDESSYYVEITTPEFISVMIERAES